MKQYLDHQQTAKLIELGFEKPKSEVKAEQAGGYAWYNPAYSIGELLNLLPSCVEWNGIYYHLYIYSQTAYSWDVSYKKDELEKKTARILPVFDSGSCLIDCLFNVLISLCEMRTEFTDIVGHNEYNTGMFVSDVFKLKE